MNDLVILVNVLAETAALDQAVAHASFDLKRELDFELFSRNNDALMEALGDALEQKHFALVYCSSDIGEACENVRCLERQLSELHGIPIFAASVRFPPITSLSLL